MRQGDEGEGDTVEGYAGPDIRLHGLHDGFGGLERKAKDRPRRRAVQGEQGRSGGGREFQPMNASEEEGRGIRRDPATRHVGQVREQRAHDRLAHLLDVVGKWLRHFGLPLQRAAVFFASTWPGAYAETLTSSVIKVTDKAEGSNVMEAGHGTQRESGRRGLGRGRLERSLSQGIRWWERIG